MKLSIHQQEHRALGSDLLLTLVGGASDVEFDDIFDSLWDYIAKFEARFSRFKSDSELTKINQSAGKKIPVSAEMRAILRAARVQSVATEGMFNAFVLPAVQKVGYRGSWPQVGNFDTKLQFDSRKLYSYKALKLTAQAVTIPADSALDLGGIGKGYLLDKLAELVPDTITGFWFSLGGDILAAGNNEQGMPWAIGIDSAEHPGLTIASAHQVAGRRLAVATSSILKRRGGDGETAWHHIIDPRTGQPADTDVQMATIIDTSATRADVLASCAIILGARPATRWLKQKGIDGYLLQQAPAGGERRLHTFGKCISADPIVVTEK